MNVKKYVFYTLIILLSFTMCGCNDKNKGSITIKEDTFLTQLNKILLNKEDYIGSEITIEGIFFNQIVDGALVQVGTIVAPLDNVKDAGIGMVELPEAGDYVIFSKKSGINIYMLLIR